MDNHILQFNPHEFGPPTPLQMAYLAGFAMGHMQTMGDNLGHAIKAADEIMARPSMDAFLVEHSEELTAAFAKLAGKGASDG